MILFSLAMLVLPAPDKGCNLSAQWGTKVPRKTADAHEVRDNGGTALWGFIQASDTALEDLASGAGRETPHRPIILYAAGTDCAVVEHYAEIIEASANCAPDWCVVSYKPAPPLATPPKTAD
ncbi:hypothetical protein P6144_19945 [Sphingomonas sp. HITSZ_GF]|uniref:hypothetical protein n=1 Tax=Sphingomonas sp. HITSZ_GF TaxID=3037247 RepID=UPI00240E394B|nr:hypothetical protein [Sphingomonas sp. HITSZ_GF]MDG2535943.1 hypothetical protein [Sphingomonas sp. HITSZ_GF]